MLWLPWARPGHSRADTRRYLRGARGAFQARAALERVVLELDSDRVIGVTSVHRIDWLRRCAGIGYWVRRSCWNRGLAREAVAATVAHAFSGLRLHRLEAHIAPDNRASQAVAEALGFQREGIAREVEFVNGTFRDHLQYGLLESDGGVP